MSDEKSPWANPDAEFQVDVPTTSPRPGVPENHDPGAGAVGPGSGWGGHPGASVGPGAASGQPGTTPGHGASGTAASGPGAAFLRRLAGGSADSDSASGSPDSVLGRPPTVAMFGWAAAAIVSIGLVVVLVLTLNGTFSGPGSNGGGLAGLGGAPEPEGSAPPLAKLCPPPTGTHTPEYAEPEPPPPGKRTVDKRAGISYAAYGDPWTTWNDDWSGGDLQVHYRVGQHFITEEYSGGTYHASILSGSVPATVNDGTILDLKCTGKQVAADVRSSYYPEPNRAKKIRDEKLTLGGRPAWISVFRLHFKEPGLKADSELVGVLLMDVGTTEAAVLYVSIPNTHKQYDYVVEEVLESARPVE